MREARTGQQVAQRHDRYMMMKFSVGMLHILAVTLSLMCLHLRLLHITGEWLCSVERLL